jgi:phenylpropionate dioxygenase-like ring-hydroxylating dioxygenase large terminal subunit
MGPRAELNFDGMVLDHVEMHECNYNWKTFIEVYLEDYHVGPFHPGLGSFVTCDDLRWEFKEPSTRCRPWAWPTAWARPAARCTSAGTKALLAIPQRRAAPSTAPSG